MTAAQFFLGLALIIFIFVAVVSGIYLNNYKTVMYANITTEELITYEVIKHKFSAVKMYSFKPSDISDNQYEMFTKILYIKEIINTSVFQVFLGISIFGILISATGLLIACIIWYNW